MERRSYPDRPGAIARGGEDDHAALLTLAARLPEYFTREAIPTMRGDLRSHLLYIAPADEVLESVGRG